MTQRRMQTMDGNTAAATVSYPFTEVAALFPITPSSPMAELTDAWAAKGKKNLFGQPVRVVEMQSEGGAAGALHGALQGGSLATTYTASQGLLLMIPNMYKIAGELLPAVFHVSARSLASNSLSIFGDHQDVMATRQSGFAMLASRSVQDVMYLGAVAHLAAIESRVPFLHFFDGFRTSHEIQRIGVLEDEELAGLLNHEAVDAFRHRALNPDHPQLRGMTHNPDVFFQLREAGNSFMNALPGIVEKYMHAINALTGSDYSFFNYHGVPDAERVIVAMGSGTSVIEETVDALNARGARVGLVTVHLYRPFLPERFCAVLPASVKRVCVLDRTKEPGAVDPLCLDVRNAFYGQPHAPLVVGGRYGLASKDFTPAQVVAVFDNLAVDTPRDAFTVGITDDVTHSSLPVGAFSLESNGVTACTFWGFGSDGTVGANKSAIKIIGDHTDLYAQAYFAYDSRKSGGVTVSHLRFGTRPIRSSCLVTSADFIACHKQAYVTKYDLLRAIKPGGTFLLNCQWNEAELNQHLPAHLKKTIADKHIRFYILNAAAIANRIGIGGRINMIMQAAFFQLADIVGPDVAETGLREAVVSSYGKQGQAVIDMNLEAIQQGIQHLHAVSVPADWSDASDDAGDRETSSPRPAFIREVIDVMNRQEGDDLPVSAFRGIEDGTWPVGISAWEKRGAAEQTPCWDPESCLQCNRCAFACPHAAIRPRLLDADEILSAPAGLLHTPAKGFPNMGYHLAVSALDCTGCGVCLNVCPVCTRQHSSPASGTTADNMVSVKGKKMPLTLTPLEQQLPYAAQLWDYVESRVRYKPLPEDTPLTVISSQFLRPLNEFSGACAGCGETPYARLITQLFGDRMMLSNAAGCSTVWAAGAPSVSYTKNAAGHGPAWGFSLFEDCAEYGFGMALGVEQMRATLSGQMRAVLPLLESCTSSTANEVTELISALHAWLEHKEEGANTRVRAQRLETALTNVLARDASPARAPAANASAIRSLLHEINKRHDYFVKRSQWIFGGDGWAYDIGYGGLDHVLASGADVNVLVFDTEVYSNTGGQASKATPTGAIAQFAAGGKATRKKDLGLMAMSYGNVYVAQIAMGASQAQTLKALIEAESYPGPSLVIAYSPCLNHGIRGGLGQSQAQARRAVESGYWTLYRHDPRLHGTGQNPFVLDSKRPDASFQDFLQSEVRYAALLRQFPDTPLFAKAERDAQERYAAYVRLAGASETMP